jgi:hypothetical protein
VFCLYEQLKKACFFWVNVWLTFPKTEQPTASVSVSQTECGPCSLWQCVSMSQHHVSGNHRWNRPNSRRVGGLLLFARLFLLAWRERSCLHSFSFIWSSRRLCMSI